MAKVFIGIPTWNRIDFVKEAVGSVIAQNFTDFRLVVSDNCSKPEFSEVISAYIDQLGDPRVSFVRQSVNGGQSGQIHYFLEQSVDEEFFAMLDDDDRYDEGFLDTAISTLMAHPEISFFSSNQYLIDENGHYLEEQTDKYNAELRRDQLDEGEVSELLELILFRLAFSISATVFRAENLREFGLLDGIDTFPPDFNIFLRQAERKKKGYWCKEKLAGYRMHMGQTTQVSSWEYNELYIASFMKLLEKRSFSGRSERMRRWLLAFAYRRYAYIKFVSGEFKEGYRYLIDALREDPLSYQAWVYSGFAALFPFVVKRLWKPRVKLIDSISK